jgi:5-methylcytosine-specific restriction endonuclease McrA
VSTRRRTLGIYASKPPLGPNGEKLCRNCKGPMPKGARHNCSKSCSDEWMCKTSPSHARLRVWERDRGVCAICRKDVVAGKTWPGGAPRRNHWRGTGDLWQVDHIKPVIEGGGECGLDGLRTLCTGCHKAETAALRKRMSQRRAEVKALPLLDRPAEAACS